MGNLPGSGPAPYENHPQVPEGSHKDESQLGFRNLLAAVAKAGAKPASQLGRENSQEAGAWKTWREPLRLFGAYFIRHGWIRCGP